MSQRIVNEATRVFQTLVDEHRGDYRAALLDLSGRFVHVCMGYSPGFMRTAADEPKAGRLDDVPAPISDEWIKTGMAT